MAMNTQCPYCTYKATRHETIDSENNPTDGDISFCIKCGETSIFHKKRLIRIIAHQHLNPTTRTEISDLRIAWLKQQAQHKVHHG